MMLDTLPSTSRRACLLQVKQAIANGSSIMGKNMMSIFGITIDPNRAEEGNTVTSPAMASYSQADFYIDSYTTACNLHGLLTKFDRLFTWPGSSATWDDCWDCVTIMTNENAYEVLAITSHSYPASDTEILTTEYMALYLIGMMSWEMGIPEELEEAKELRDASSKQHITKSAMRGVPIRLVSVLDQNIRILTTYFTREYYLSFKRPGQPKAGSLQVHVESFPAMLNEKGEKIWLRQEEQVVQRLMDGVPRMAKSQTQWRE